MVTTFFDPMYLFLPEAYFVETATGSGFLFEEGGADYLLSEHVRALGLSWNGFFCLSGERAMLMIAYEHPEWSTDGYPVLQEKVGRVTVALQRLAPDYLAAQEQAQ